MDKMAIKDQVSATEQMKKIDDIQESHMVGGWGRERWEMERKGRGSLVPMQDLGGQEFLPAL